MPPSQAHARRTAPPRGEYMQRFVTPSTAPNGRQYSHSERPSGRLGVKSEPLIPIHRRTAKRCCQRCSRVFQWTQGAQADPGTSGRSRGLQKIQRAPVDPGVFHRICEFKLIQGSQVDPGVSIRSKGVQRNLGAGRQKPRKRTPLHGSDVHRERRRPPVPGPWIRWRV